MYQRLLVSIDLGQPGHARQILETALAMPRTGKGEVHVLTVVPDYGMTIVGSYFDSGFEGKALEKAQSVLRDFLAESAAGAQANIKGHVAHGRVYAEILRVAEELDCDLVVIGAQDPAPQDYLLGPNAARVVRHCPRSVLVVREKD